MIDTIGWDIGGAHLKAVRLKGGSIEGVVQSPCPLWRGLEHLENAIDEIMGRLGLGARHAITMTGELADIFQNRNEGVVQLVDTMRRKLPEVELTVFAGIRGFVDTAQAETAAGDIASSNWLASAQFAAQHCWEGIFIDMGSTTTDIIALHRGEARPYGLTDAARLTSEELVYTGVVRTPLMAIATRAPFNGEWQRIAAEHFATAADVHRLTGNLDEEHDMAETADGAGKTVEESARRIARMVGRDFEDAGMANWTALAHYFADAQLGELRGAVERVSSRVSIPRKAPLVGAGAGRFMVRELARQMHRDYIDFSQLVDGSDENKEWAAVCAPAFSVAWLADQQHGVPV